MMNNKILIVEDERIFALEIRGHLEIHGYEVLDIVSSGEKAFDVIENERPDLILLDIKLSGKMDGIEISKRINEEFDIPIIFMTAMSNEVTVQAALKNKPFGYIVKPVNLLTMFSTIEIALYKHKNEKKIIQEIHKRKKIAKDLERSKNIIKDQLEFMNSLVETLPDPVFYKDREGKYLGCNKAFEQYIGKEKNEIIGKTVFDVASSEIAEEYHKRDLELFNSGEKQIYEYKVADASGNEKDVIFRKAVFYDNEGKIAGLIGSMSDITDIKIFEKKLIENEKKYRLVTENIPLIFYTADVEMVPKTIFITGRIKDLTGYNKEDFIGNSKLFSDIIHPEDLNYVQEKIKQYLHDNSEISIEYRIVRKDNIIKWIRNVANPMFDDALRLIQFDGFIEDITDDRLTKDDLALTQSKMEGLINSMSDYVLLFDEDTRLKYFNFPESIKKITLKSQNVIGKKHSELFPDYINVLFNKGFEKNRNGHTAEYNCTFDFPDGKRYFSVSLSPVVIGNIFSGSVAVVRDISPMKNLEHEIANISLRERQKMSQGLHDGVGQQLTGISIHLKALETKLNKGITVRSEEIKSVIDVVEQALETTRDLARDFSPVFVEKAGFETALESFLNNIKKMTNIKYEIKKKGAFSIKDNDVANNLYYIAQEALNNAIKHSNAKKITVELEKNRKGLKVVIRNDGVPKNKQRNGDGLGMKLMAYRAEIIGASINFEEESNNYTVSILLNL